MVTTNLPFDEWTDVFGSERLTDALQASHNVVPSVVVPSAANHSALSCGKSCHVMLEHVFVPRLFGGPTSLKRSDRSDATHLELVIHHRRSGLAEKSISQGRVSLR